MKLSKRNYYTIRNQYITNSKISDYLRDKNYFYRKHILGTVERKESDAFLFGSAVDTWLTDSEKAFREQYIPVARRSKANASLGFTEVPQAMYDQIETMCRKLESLTIFKQLRGFKNQKILQFDLDLGKFPGIAGIPDWYKIMPSGTEATIIDLKTTKSVVPKKYYHSCVEYGYIRQQAMYQMLIKLNNPEVKTFKSFHLAVEKDTDNIFKTRLFKIPQNLIDSSKSEIDLILDSIKKEEKFLSEDVSFESAVNLVE